MNNELEKLFTDIIIALLNNLSFDIYNQYGEEVVYKFLERFDEILKDEELIKNILAYKGNFLLEEKFKEEFIKKFIDIVPNFEEIFEKTLNKFSK